MTVKIKLTEEQLEALLPLFDAAHEASLKGKRGSIIMQPIYTEQIIRGDFVEREYAVEICDILQRRLDDKT